MSRLVFHAQIHNGGIRGKIIRQRRENNNDIWVPDKAIDIRKLGKNEAINIEINTNAVKKLYEAFLKLSEILKEKGIQYGENSYAVVDPSQVVITDKNKREYIKKLLDGGYTDEVWENIVDLHPNLATALSIANIQQQKQKIVNELRERLKTNIYKETAGVNSWQSWIFKHNWLFGVNYQEPLEKTKINLSGIMPDYLFPTLDGFVDVLEIKLPSDEVIIEDNSHPGSWIWSAETNKAFGQVVNYVEEMPRLRLEIEKQIKNLYGKEVYIIKPRAFILIGNSSNWTQTKKEALRKLNGSLHSIEVITYNELLVRGTEATKIASIV